MQLVKFLLFPHNVGPLWTRPSTLIVGAAWGTFEKRNALPDILQHWTEEYIHTYINTFHGSISMLQRKQNVKQDINTQIYKQMNTCHVLLSTDVH
jgi:hypothetical protein